MSIEDRTKILLGPNYEKMEKIKESVNTIDDVKYAVQVIKDIIK